MASGKSCPCSNCRKRKPHPDKLRHRQLRTVLARLDEQQRRWVAALEADRIGWGGIGIVALVSGMDPKTIRKGKRELQDDLAERPLGRTRKPGAGRPKVEKKAQP